MHQFGRILDDAKDLDVDADRLAFADPDHDEISAVAHAIVQPGKPDQIRLSQTLRADILHIAGNSVIVAQKHAQPAMRGDIAVAQRGQTKALRRGHLFARQEMPESRRLASSGIDQPHGKAIRRRRQTSRVDAILAKRGIELRGDLLDPHGPVSGVEAERRRDG